ncbi:COX6C domain-containing protein [Aphelenchoides besseyi]|nr:COX6C domain-containing protein [Aphelenchoides besseyi]
MSGSAVNPPFPLRSMLHNKARKFIWSALAVSVAATVAHNVFYVWPRHNKYEEYFKNYDAYARMKEICSYEYKYLHTCPSELAKLAEEKGVEIAPLE